jgi:hypothetical protein
MLCAEHGPEEKYGGEIPGMIIPVLFWPAGKDEQDL